MSDTLVQDETLTVRETQVDEPVTPDADPATTLEQPAHELVLASPDTDPAVTVEGNAGTIKRTHPTTAMQIIFDGNVLNIPVGTPSEMLENDAVLRRAYSISMGMPALLEARMIRGETEIEGFVVPTRTLQVRTHVKGAATTVAPDLVRGLQRIPRADRRQCEDSALVQALLDGDGHMTVALAVALSLGDRCERILHPTTRYGGDLALCRLLDTIPSVAVETHIIDESKPPLARLGDIIRYCVHQTGNGFADYGTDVIYDDFGGAIEFDWFSSDEELADNGV